MTLDLRCYLVTSGTGRHTVETAAAAAGAGAGMVQVRAKELSTRDLFSLVLQVGEAVRRANPRRGWSMTAPMSPGRPYGREGTSTGARRIDGFAGA